MTDQTIENIILNINNHHNRVIEEIKALRNAEKTLISYLKACGVKLPKEPKQYIGRKKSTLHPTDCVCLNSRCKAIKCVETGIIYDSVRQAARMIGVAAPSISICLDDQCKTCYGYHWITVEKTA